MSAAPELRTGTLGIGPDGSFRIHFERVLHHPVADVWAAITDPAKLEIWLPGCRIDARPGGSVVHDFGEEGCATGEVTGVRPPVDDGPGELEHTWLWEGVAASVVVWRLEATEHGTRLTLTHREVPAGPATDFAIGWHVILETLDRFVDGRSWDDVWEGLDVLVEHYAAPAP